MRRLIKIPITVFLMAVFLFPSGAGAKTFEECIYIVPAGKVDTKILAKLKNRLPGMFPMSVKAVIDPGQEFPQAAYDPSRRQYDAQKVIDDISQRIVLTLVNERALIVTEEDLYIPGADFVFGLADDKKGIAIVSLARLRNEFYGQKPGERLLAERAIKKAACELGRSWKISACKSQKCVMFPSAIPADIDKERESFCYKCCIAIENRYGSRGLIGQKKK